MTRNLFVNESTGALGKVVSTDESYAYLEIMHPKPSNYAMPRKEYDRLFHTQWRPARAEDLNQFEAPIELPAQAPAEWVEQVQDVLAP